MSTPPGLDILLDEVRRRGFETLQRLLDARPSPLFHAANDPERDDWEPAAINLGLLTEMCGTETSGHLQRVPRYVGILIRDLRPRGTFPEIDEIWEEQVIRASPLHDLGKIAVPPGILLKPGPLSPSEREIMKLHVPLGADSLEAMRSAHPATQFWSVARDIAATHHERGDGSGYPLGLVGEAIPLPGRIVALVDVYDALTSRRVYKSAMSHESARDLIVEQAGGPFDARLVESFLRNEAAFREVVERFRD